MYKVLLEGQSQLSLSLAYELLKYHDWRMVSPHPKLPKKADVKTILASKNKIFIREESK